MKITFSINSKLQKDKIFEGMKKVLFLSMLKMDEIAVMNCPVDTGRLRVSINLLPAVPGYASYILAAGTEYAAAVEFGTSPRTIIPVKKSALKFKIRGKDIIVKKVMHPGTEAQPFFRPALDIVKGVWVGRYWNQVFKETQIFK